MGIPRYDTADEIAYMGLKIVADRVKSGESDFTLHYKSGLKDAVHARFDESARDILKSYGVYTAIDTCAAFTVKYYDKLDDLKKNGLAKVRAAADNGVTEFRLCFKESLYKDFHEFVINAIGDYRTGILVVPYEPLDEVTKAIPAVANSAKNGGKSLLSGTKKA